LTIKLQDKVALITGGGRGIGRTVAEMLADSNVAVAIMGRSMGSLSDTVSMIESAGGRALAVRGDVLNRKDISAAVEEVETSLGPIDVLINNAGVGGAAGPLWQTDEDEWWWVQEVNVRGPYMMMHAVLGGMVERGSGCIINMGSYQGIFPSPNSGAYATSKAALLRLTDSTAGEVADKGISVFCISPGFVDTDMTRDLEAKLREVNPEFEGFDESYKFPAEACGALCVRLASGEADALTGRMIHVRDDLDGMIEAAENIVEEDRYALRLTVDLND
jgi:NAD(P)-dependent dehydrogenase (short-subunit alcohol dehydrogenase family)